MLTSFLRKCVVTIFLFLLSSNTALSENNLKYSVQYILENDFTEKYVNSVFHLLSYSNNIDLVFNGQVGAGIMIITGVDIIKDGKFNLHEKHKLNERDADFLSSLKFENEECVIRGFNIGGYNSDYPYTLVIYNITDHKDDLKTRLSCIYLGILYSLNFQIYSIPESEINPRDLVRKIFDIDVRNSGDGQ